MRAPLVLLLAALTVCGGVAYGRDRGPRADRTAIRTLASTHPHATVSDIAVVGHYAIAQWVSPPAGGQTVYRKDAHGAWHELATGGGAYSAQDLEKLGVPAKVARALVPGSPG